MNGSSLFYKFLTVLVIVCFLAACNQFHPEKWSTVKSVYKHSIDVEGAQDDSIKTSTFEAPFADVFPAVERATAMANLNLEDSDEELGILYLTRAVQMQNQTRYFYKVMVKEKGPETTDVTILAKSQGSCMHMGPGYWPGVILTAFILLPFLIINNSKCAEISALKWDYSSLPEMHNVLNFTKNNLIAAGVL